MVRVLKSHPTSLDLTYADYALTLEVPIKMMNCVTQNLKWIAVGVMKTTDWIIVGFAEENADGYQLIALSYL